jgi:heme-degrading monooxygenase HmoA
VIAANFESWPADGKSKPILLWRNHYESRLDGLDGFISIERFQRSAIPPVPLSFWRDEAVVDYWRNASIHRTVQTASRRDVFRDNRLRVATVIRDCGRLGRAHLLRPTPTPRNVASRCNAVAATSCRWHRCDGSTAARPPKGGKCHGGITRLHSLSCAVCCCAHSADLIWRHRGLTFRQ